MSTDPIHSRRAYAVVRSLILAISTLAIVGVLFAVYQYSTGTTPDEPVVTTAVDQPPPIEPTAPAPGGQESAGSLPMGEGQVGGGERITISLYDAHGQHARAELEVTDYKPSGNANNEFHVVEPEIRVRTPDGQEIRVVADEGWIQLASADARNPEVKSGTFVGHVRIDIDRLSKEQRDLLPPDQRIAPDGDRLIHLEFQEIVFDLEENRLDSSGPFTMRMAEAELAGDGLRVRYNDIAARIELLQIFELKQMVINAESSMFEAAVPGGGATVVTTTPAAALPADAESPSLAPADVVAEKTTAPDEAPAASPTEAGGFANADLDALDVDTEDLPIFIPDPPDEPKQWPTQTYVVEIDRDVTIQQVVGNKTVWNLAADKVNLLFDFGEEQRVAARSGKIPQPGETTPAGQTVPQTPTDQSASPRIVLRCEGAFVLRPQPAEDVDDDDDQPLGRRVRLAAKGNPVRFTDPRASITCAGLDIQQDTGRLFIQGTEDQPVVLHTAQCAELVAASVEIDRAQGEARIEGPAKLASYGRQSTHAATGSPQDVSISDVDIRFDDQAILTLDTHTVRRLDPTTKLFQDVSIEFISEATFAGNVRMKRGDDLINARSITMTFEPPTEPGAFAQNLLTLDAQGDVLMLRGDDQINCGVLTVLFAKDPAGRSVPRWAQADDDVVITQGTRTFTANERVTIRMASMPKIKPPFDPVTARLAALNQGVDPAAIDEAALKRRYEQKIEYAVGLESIDAVGGVTAFDPTDGLNVDAEQLRADFDNGRDLRSAHIAGPEGVDAHVNWAQSSVSAHVIDVNFPEETIVVEGAGHLGFVTQRGLDGRRTATSQHVAISWNQEMVFKGKQNTAHFLGHVHAQTNRVAQDPQTFLARWNITASKTTNETSSFDCDELVIDFVDTSDQTTTPGEHDDQWWVFEPVVRRWGQNSGTQRPKLGKEPVYLVASRDVVGVFSNTNDTTGRIESRVRIAAQKLAVDLRSELMNVPVKGTILIEDYRAGDSQEPSSKRVTSLFDSDVGATPSQSYISWAESMSFYYGRNRADFRKDVVIVHRRGADMVFADKLLAAKNADNQPAAANLGRQTRLECQSLLVEFASNVGNRPDQPGSETPGALSVRDIRQLDATGGVRLTDDDFSITAYRLAKYPRSDLLRVIGLDEDAEIYSKSPTGPRFRGREFSYNLVTGSVEAAGKHQVRIRR